MTRDDCLLSAEIAMLLLAGDDPECAALRDWMPTRQGVTLYVSALGLAWVRSDIEAISDISRRGQLKDEMEETLEYRFQHRKLPIDDAALRRWATIRHLEHQGDTLTTEEALEISIALSHDLTFVARHSELRAKSGVRLEDPFATTVVS